MRDNASCSCGCPNTFSTKEAADDLKRYSKRGPDGTTRALIEAIVAEGVEGATLLDIGAGIGAIQLGLLQAGVARAESIDASEAYVIVARAEADREGFASRTHARVGDFTELAGEIAPADIVTLDRVVCCDPDLDALLGRAAEHARRIVGLVYPREAWWNRIASHALNLFCYLIRDPTRWYLHPIPRIDAILRNAGFERRDVDRSLVWQVALYVRS